VRRSCHIIADSSMRLRMYLIAAEEDILFAQPRSLSSTHGNASFYFSEAFHRKVLPCVADQLR